MTIHEAFSPAATSAKTDEPKFRPIEGKFEDSKPAERQTSGPFNRLFRILVGVLSAPKGDQGGWEGGARGL
jgi:hypothetical protein